MPGSGGRHEIRENGAEGSAIGRLMAAQRRIDDQAAVRWTQTELACAVCGGAIEQPSGAGRPRVTCSDACRAKRSREQRRRWNRIS